MDSQEKIVEFGDFMGIAVVFYKSMGIDAFTSQGKYGIFEKIFQVIIFFLGTGNLIFIIIGETVYLVKSFGAVANFLQITGLLPCIGVCSGSIAKILTVWSKKAQLKAILHQLEDMFPQTVDEQEEFHIETYRKHVPRMILPCTVVSMLAVWVFNLSDFFESFINYFRNGNFEKVYPYFVWYPFDDQTNWAYALVYLHQSYAGYVAVGSSMATDLLLCCIINQLRMHFDFISRQLLKMVPKGRPADLRRVKRLIQHHITVLRISDEVSDVFGFSNLYNFISSSLIICLTGFQVSAGVTNKDLIKYILFLIYQLLTVFLVCYHGNIVMDSSLEVCNAAYGQEWFQSDQKYKKILLFLLTRASRPSMLNATSLVAVSLMTFNRIISSSYQFFALVRSMYGDG